MRFYRLLPARRRRAAALASTALVAAALAAPVPAGAAEIDTLRVFGDSYSALSRKAFPNWAELLRNDGTAAELVGFARSGATAATVGTNHFKKQYNTFTRTSPTFGTGDLTVVYLGYNDIDRFADLTRSKADYATYVNRIIGRGATGDGARLFLVQVHDWGRNPDQGGDVGGVFRGRTLEWNRHVASVGDGRAGVTVVDLFSFFENVYANPGQFGLVNVTTANSSRSTRDYLYQDPNHFGRKGQTLIRQVFDQYLNRAGDLVATLGAGDRAARRRGRELEAGLALNAAAALTDEGDGGVGLSAFPVGEAAALGLARLDEAAAAAWSDAARSGFDQLHHRPEEGDGGLGLNYDLGGGTRLGIVVAQYGEDVRTAHDLSTAEGGVESDTVALYLDHGLGGLELGTRLVYGNDTHVHRLYDELIGEGDRATFGGRTMELSQRAGYPVAAAGGAVTLTPWVQLTQRRQETDAFTMANPYTSEATYEAAAVSDTEASLGLDAAGAAIPLGDGRARLFHFGGISYTHSLLRDDYELSITEAAVQGFTERQTVERPELRTVGLNLGAQLEVGERLSLGAGLGVSADPALGTEESARLNLTYRF
jgi:hypothetical protein